MNINLFYFSGTGNTYYICNKFKNELESRGHIIKLCNIEDDIYKNEININESLTNADIIGIAYPVYGAKLPKIMDLFIEKIPKNTFVNKPSFIISTVGVINAFGPFIIRKRLNTLGIKLKWHYVYYTINNTKNKKATKEMLDLKHTNNNNSFLKFINNIIKNEPYIKGVGPWLIGGYLVRLILKKPIEYHYKTFRVDTSICSNCLLCVRKCPMGAITYDENKYCFSNKCTTCFRCVNRCPKNAIYEIKNA